MASTEIFVGREEELEDLRVLTRKKAASFVVVKGRRRVGKSCLLAEFGKEMRTLTFVGLPPVDATTKQSQLDEFARQLGRNAQLPEFKTDDWSQLFQFLGKETASGRVLIILDEISWIGSCDPDFLGKLKNAWDGIFSRNPELLLVVCGSVSTWIENNILKNTAFYGRISWSITLEPLPLPDCNKLLEAQNFRGSPYEKFKILAVTGGIPWYLEQIQGDLTADENIKRQCFTKSGVLFEEFEKVFHDVFGKRDRIYKHIIDSLADGPLEYDKISKATQYPSSGRLSEYLEDLEMAGFILRDYAWSLKTGKQRKISRYRLSDNYLRFYLNYIAPRKEQIARGHYRACSLSTLSEWDTISGLQFENLVLNNRRQIFDYLQLRYEEILGENPYYQRETKTQRGCQIDYLIQTKFGNLYLFEIKFSRKPIGMRVVEEIREKISRLALPRNLSVMPILIHVNGVSEKTEQAGFFFKIIDFSRFLIES